LIPGGEKRKTLQNRYAEKTILESTAKKWHLTFIIISLIISILITRRRKYVYL